MTSSALQPIEPVEPRIAIFFLKGMRLRQTSAKVKRIGEIAPVRFGKTSDGKTSGRLHNCFGGGQCYHQLKYEVRWPHVVRLY